MSKLRVELSSTGKIACAEDPPVLTRFTFIVYPICIFLGKFPVVSVWFTIRSGRYKGNGNMETLWET